MQITNSYIVRILNKSLDPLMTAHGFMRKGRVYYKQSGDILFLLGTKAVGSYFAAVTGFPSHAFSLIEGFWIDGVDYWDVKVNLTKPNIILPDLDIENICFHVQSNIDGSINRKLPHPYRNERHNGLQGLSENEAERNDLWVMPENETELPEFIEEMHSQIHACFLDKYEELLSLDKLEEYTIGRLHQYNIERGFTDDMPFEEGVFGGNYKHYLNYAVLFYKKYGPIEKYQKLSARLNEWRIANKSSPWVKYEYSMNKQELFSHAHNKKRK